MIPANTHRGKSGRVLNPVCCRRSWECPDRVIEEYMRIYNAYAL